MKEKSDSQKAVINRAIGAIRKRIQLNDQNIIKLLDWSSVTKKEFCSVLYTVRAFYEYPDNDLASYTKHKKNGLKMIEGNELEGMTNGFVNGLKNLHHKHHTHGDVEPKYLGAFNSDFKIMDRLDNPMNQD